MCHSQCQSSATTTGALSHRWRAVKGLSHIADTYYGRYYSIWHEWNVLTVSKVEVLASWGGAEDGKLAVCPPLYMRAPVTARALCQIMRLSRGHYLSVSLLVFGGDSGWTGHTAVPGCSAPDTQASNKTAGHYVCFCVCANNLFFWSVLLVYFSVYSGTEAKSHDAPNPQVSFLGLNFFLCDLIAIPCFQFSFLSTQKREQPLSLPFFPFMWWRMASSDVVTGADNLSKVYPGLQLFHFLVFAVFFSLNSLYSQLPTLIRNTSGLAGPRWDFAVSGSSGSG